MFLSRHQRHPKLFGCVAVGLLLNWLVLTLGIPLPTWHAKDSSRPFPCMDSVCGCHTAEKCWKSCCCHSNQEKLAWAKRNGVTPPNYVIVAAKKEAKSKAASHDSCCTKPHSAAKLTQKKPAQSKTKQAKHAEESAPAESGQWVLSSVRRCQGNASVNVNSELATVIIQVTAYPPMAPPALWIELVDHSALSLDLSPASPPPQLG